MLKELKRGSFGNNGVASWSTEKYVSQRFADNGIGYKQSSVYGDTKTIKVILVSKNHEKATSIRHLSSFSGEYEVLASKDCRYKFVKKWKSNNYLYIEVEPSM